MHLRRESGKGVRCVKTIRILKGSILKVWISKISWFFSLNKDKTITKHICVYVCFYVCDCLGTHVCVYACKYVCMYVMRACVCMHVCNVCMYACVYVRMWIYAYLCKYARACFQLFFLNKKVFTIKIVNTWIFN